MKEVLKDKDYVKVQITPHENPTEASKEESPKIEQAEEEFEGRGKRHCGKGGWFGKGRHHGKHGHHGFPFPPPPFGFGPFGHPEMMG